MSSKLQQALDCSLEDYIAEKGIVSTLRPQQNGSTKPGYFKRPLRSETEEDENEDDRFFEDRNGMDVTPSTQSKESLTAIEAKEQSSEETNAADVDMTLQLDTNTEQRTFVTEEFKRGIKHMPSQQWRLLRQNQVWQKPSGVPPLKAMFDRNTEQLIASFGENAQFRNADARNRINQKFNNQRNNRNFNQQNNRNNNGNNRRNWNNRNRNQYGKSPYMVPSFNPNVEKMEHRSNTQIVNNNGNGNQVQDLRTFITPPSSLQSFAGQGLNRPGPSFGQPQLVTFADMLNRIGQASTMQDRDTFTDVIRNVMRTQQQQQASAMMPAMNPESFSRMSSNELMPFAAQTLLNHISTVQENFGPKYDMKVQKEIHTLQGKTMFYRSSGVVSADGPGINGEHIKPVTTDLSMNMRFS
ncbi:putative mediator of RNA polymerase II transcription subunit 24 [Wyeomyia smithii]|uniref:putative mediator of RNA polymerase II transcription subunit 24 n=1 Tax=Wyeomyia smithii TaxID=174621 RepID=UPI002467EC7E|nr:putative mediator of RNA polymerase II transcription subunit 24 [Wyeomyia smithii]